MEFRIKIVLIAVAPKRRNEPEGGSGRKKCLRTGSEKRQFWAVEASGEVERVPYVVAEALDTENPPVRLHSEAVRRMLSVGRDLKSEMLAQKA
jgi:ribosomal protein L13